MSNAARESAIPIRNLWHMLLYAWDALRYASQWRTEVEQAPSLDALTATILLRLLRQRLRTGLGRSYVDESQTLQTIRGRIDFGTSLRTNAFHKGRVHCRFQSYDINAPKNQVIKAAMHHLTRTGQFGPNAGEAREMRQELRAVVRELDAVDWVEPSVEKIRRICLGRNETDYRLMLAMCELALRRRMPTQWAGQDHTPLLDLEAITQHAVFEKFVSNFYKMHLTQWRVQPQPVFNWPARGDLDHLPRMRPDLVLTHRPTGRRVVLDTKFTPHSLLRHGGKDIFDSKHIYQIFAYVASQAHKNEACANATGVLLYPAAGRALDERFTIQNMSFALRTVDLAADWPAVENELLEIMQQCLQ